MGSISKRLLVIFYSLPLFVPLYGEWKLTGNLTYARTGFQGCLLTDGRMMVWGGMTNPPGGESTSEIFAPATGSWTLGATPASGDHRIGIHLPNGRVLYVKYGGVSYIFDPFTNIWTEGPEFGAWSLRGCASLLKNGKVIVMGFNSSAPRECKIYDYATNSVAMTSNSIYNHTQGGVEVVLNNGEILLAGGGYLDSGTRQCEIYNPDAGTWRPTGDMNIARASFVGILLPPPWDKVLVAGDHDTPYLQTELFDVESGTWSYTGNLNYPERETPTLIMLPSGKPILIGGLGALQAEIYNPSDGTWSLTSNMNSIRSHFTSVILHTGKVLAISGYNSSDGTRTNTAEIYDPSKPIWKMRTVLHHSRKFHTASLLPIIHTSNCSTNVLITGGEISDDYLKVCELYNYIEERVTVTGSFNHSRSRHTTVLLPTGKVLAAGGKNVTGALPSCELYSVSEERWTITDSMGEARFDNTATLLKDGKVLVTGGEGSFGYINSCEIYDPTSGMWIYTGNLTTPRARHTATLLLDGRVIVIGGENSSGILSSCEIWSPSSGTWVTTANLSTARCAHSSILLQSGKVMVIGGKGVSGNALTECEVYSTIPGRWDTGAPLNNARYYHNATLTYSGLVLVSGGYDGNNYLQGCEIYDPAIKPPEWKLTTPLLTPRACHSSCVVPDEKPFVLVFGGETNGGLINSVEEYDIGLGYRNEWQSIITSHQAVTHLTTPMNIEGDLFRGVTEADGGNHCHIASSDHPIIALLRVGGGNFQNNGGGEMLIMPLSSYWDEKHTDIYPPADAAQGYYTLWSIVNGIPCKWYKGCVQVEESITHTGQPIEWRVYPNPSTKRAGIYFMTTIVQPLTIKIYDCTGRLVKEETIEGKNSKLETIDLKCGVYFYSIEPYPIKGKFILL